MSWLREKTIKMIIKKYQQVWDFWEEYKEALWSYVFKYSQSKEITDDIVQDVLLKIHKSCCSNREIKNIRSWLFQIAYNSLMDFYKVNKKDTVLVRESIEETESDVYQEFSVFLNPLINFLPPKYAIPLRLADIEGMKQKEIATKLNLSLTATKSRIQRARTKLKEEVHTCFHVKECETSGLLDFQLKKSCKPLQNLPKENK